MRIRNQLAVLALGAAVLFSSATSEAQRILASGSSGDVRASNPTATSASAIRASTPMVIDGKGSDPQWATAPLITGFRVFDPVEDGEPSMKTEARVAYDDHNLYVLIRAYDPHPDSIMALLSRRDERTQSDYLRVIIDSYHDKR
ncbi:MAG: sugar-binding protein, partial [Gemmatimonadaceae bacterium]